MSTIVPDNVMGFQTTPYYNHITTESYTTGTGPNRLMVVFLSTPWPSDLDYPFASSITYNGVPLTPIVGDNGTTSIQAWILKNPSEGTHDLVVNGSASVQQNILIVGVRTYFGVDQTHPIAFNEAQLYEYTDYDYSFTVEDEGAYAIVGIAEGYPDGPFGNVPDYWHVEEPFTLLYDNNYDIQPYRMNCGAIAEAGPLEPETTYHLVWYGENDPSLPPPPIPYWYQIPFEWGHPRICILVLKPAGDN